MIARTVISLLEMEASSSPQNQSDARNESIVDPARTEDPQETSNPKMPKKTVDDRPTTSVLPTASEQASQRTPVVETASRIMLSSDELNSMDRCRLIDHWNRQQDYVQLLEHRLQQTLDSKEQVVELEQKLKQQLFDSTRRENILIMKLTKKEQDTQDYIVSVLTNQSIDQPLNRFSSFQQNQIQELKSTLMPSDVQLQNALLDPAVNLMFEDMKKEVDKAKTKVDDMQSELSAWKFTPDSNTGKRLMAKCRLLYQENEELGKVISSGRIAKLEGDLALQKSFSEEMKKSQAGKFEIELHLICK